MTPSLRWLVAVGAWLSLGGASPRLEALEHPTLVSVESAQCTVCHEDVLQGRAFVHSPVDEDCTVCHEFSVDERGTVVELADSEPALCVMCHDDLAAASEMALEAPHLPVGDSCLSCHEVHASDRRSLLVEAAGQLCFSCHDLEETDSSHPIPVSRASCGTCHEAHGSDHERMLIGGHQHVPFAERTCTACHRKPRGVVVRMRTEGAKLCTACHADIIQETAAGVVHEAVRQGQCTGCHDPHLASSARLLKRSGGELCFPCHQDVQSEVTGEGAHPAVEAGCDACHQPHQSEHRALLVEDPGALCGSCHDLEDEALVEFHLGAELSELDCSSCHVPHGSGEEHLLAAGSIHYPFAEDCGNCHEEGAEQLAEGGGNALCSMCHADIPEFAAAAVVPHGAMELGQCIDCHTPHAARQQKLLRAPGSGVCVDCHEEQVAAADEIPHGATEWIGCHSCHLPHGGENPRLLRRTGNGLCQGCHLKVNHRDDPEGVLLPGGFALSDEQAADLRVIDLDEGAQRGHPIPDHPVAGVMTQGRGKTRIAKDYVGAELSCVTCHTPHAGKTAKLFARGATSRSQVCIECHAK